MTNTQKLNTKLKLKWTQIRAGVKKTDNREDIDKKTLKFANKLGHKVYNIQLDEHQEKNPEFLLSLYKTNANSLDHFSPSKDDENLQKEINFMFEYVKLAHARKMEQSEDTLFVAQLRWIVNKYRTTMTTPDFIILLTKEFPTVPIIPLIHESAKRLDSWKSVEQINEDNQLFDNCIEHLPKELLLDQTRKFGHISLEFISKKLPYYNELVSVGIEKDGFKSLEQLNISQVLENKDLVIKAYKKDGFDSLFNYIAKTLSPKQAKLTCKSWDKPIFNKQYADVQLALLHDNEIMKIYEEEYKKRENQQVINKKFKSNNTNCDINEDEKI